MSEPYETTSIADREEVAAVLAGIADGVLAGTVRMGEGDDATTVAVPAAVELEVELEIEDDEVELEVELEWPVEDAAERDGADESPDVEETTETPAEETTETPAEETADAPPEGGVSEVVVDDGDIAVPVDPVVPVGTDDGSGSLARFELYRDRADEWRWRLRHRNGNVIATSGEGYTRKHNARKGIRSVVRNAPGAETRDEG